jgi:hypothetical protein
MEAEILELLRYEVARIEDAESGDVIFTRHAG